MSQATAERPAAPRVAAGVKLTPMIEQYLDVKSQYPDAILLYRLGDFYEMFFEDAELASGLLDLTLTARNKGDEVPVPLCGVPYHSVEPYIMKLVESGHKVAVCEQVEDPALAKGIVERRVVRVVTPGTVLEEESLEPREPNYLAAIVGEGLGVGLAIADLSTGELRAAELESREVLREELARLRPREVVYCEGSLAPEALASTGARRVSAAPRDRFAARPLERWPSWQGPPLASRALGGLLACLEEQLVSSEHLRLPEIHRPDAFLVIDEPSRRNLELTETLRGEFRGSLLWVIDRTVTPMGGRALRRWLLYPLVDPAEVGSRLEGVEELVERAAVREDLRASLDGLGDLERLAGRVGTGNASPRDVARLAYALERADALRATVADARSELLRSAREEIFPMPELRDEIRRALRDDPPVFSHQGDVIRDGYSAEVDELRRLGREGRHWIAALEASEREKTGIGSLKVRYNKVFGYYIEVTKPNLRLVPGDYQRKQTIAGGERFVTPELKEHEANVLGAEERLRRLERELFDGLVSAVAKRLPEIGSTASAIGRIDVLASLAEVAERHRFVRPEISTDRVLEIAEGRHPVVERVLPAGRFVPNDTSLDPDRSAQLAILTGPNMAGKSTYLRQNALIVVLAQMGSFVPAARARIGVTDRIFTRVGASDDLAAGDSTFMVEMKETAHILSHLTRRSLVVLDEIGRGTSTFDGISIAWAVAEHLHAAPERPRTLFATHFHELTELTATAERAVNLSVAVKEWKGDVVFLRRVVPGPASQSYGIHVARLAGVPEAVIRRAREILSRLESGERSEVGGAPEGQLGLFPLSPAPRLLEEIRGIDPLTLTPIEALARLADLVEKAKGAS